MIVRYQWVGFLCILAGGCSSETREKISLAVQEKTEAISSNPQTVVESVSEKIASKAILEKQPQPGQIDLQTDRTITLERCFAEQVQFSDGRPNVLKITSYSDVQQETFPSVYVHVFLKDADAQSLDGRTLEARTFVQHKNKGPVYFSAESTLVKLKFSKSPNGAYTATIVDGLLTRTDNGVEVPTSGTLTFEIR